MKQQRCILLQFWKSEAKINVLASCAPSRVSGGKNPLCLIQLLAAILGNEATPLHLCLHLHMAYLCLLSSVSSRDTCHWMHYPQNPG